MSFKLVMFGRRFFSCSASQTFKRKSSHQDVFRMLPRVPTTQFLESRELTRDILFSGYRPVMYPVTQNPLLTERNRNGETTLVSEVIGERRKEEQQHNDHNYSVMAGPRGCGGIHSGGVNGTWRYSPKLPNKLLPYNIWTTTSMGMEYFPEWLNLPRQVVRKLKPFDRH